VELLRKSIKRWMLRTIRLNSILIENPAFDSQTKETLTLKQSAFGSKCEISDSFIKKVLQCGIID
jgi:DNA gyrase/topoisomerase IV subunit B